MPRCGLSAWRCGNNAEFTAVATKGLFKARLCCAATPVEHLRRRKQGFLAGGSQACTHESSVLISTDDFWKAAPTSTPWFSTGMRPNGPLVSKRSQMISQQQSHGSDLMLV